MQTGFDMSNQEFKIEDGIKLVDFHKSAGRARSAFTAAIVEMKSGQSLYPASRSQVSQAWSLGRLHGFRIATRRDGEAYRIFKLEAK